MNFSYKLILSILLINFSINSFAQSPAGGNSFYTTSGGEIIFSWAEVTKDSLSCDVITRFSPVLNLQFFLHRDLSQHFGVFSGMCIRNVGFIFDDPTTVNTRYKARTYTLGIPISLKAGKMDGFFIFGGYEIEFPFNYKEKKFVNEDKVEKNTSWFSDKTPSIYHSFFAGFQTPFGTQIKFKYYITNFFNKSYVAADENGDRFNPYANIDAKVFYVSLSWQLFHGKHVNYKKVNPDNSIKS
jgi:hypothetical protein